MKKIGFLNGPDSDFSDFVIEYINKTHASNAIAKKIIVDAINSDSVADFDLIFDRVSDKVPFFNSVMKYYASIGIQIINNPFSCRFNDNFLLNTILKTLNIETLRTVLLPSKEQPLGTDSSHFSNLVFPLNWKEIFNYIGFPSVIKLNQGSNINNSYVFYNEQEFFSVYDFTGDSVMILQQFVDYSDIIRCFVAGDKSFAFFYDARKPIHMRFYNDWKKIDSSVREKIEKNSVEISKTIGLDFNTLDFIVKDKKVYAIDYYNSNPEINKSYMPADIFEWLVKSTADMLVSRSTIKSV